MFGAREQNPHCWQQLCWSTQSWFIVPFLLKCFQYTCKYVRNAIAFFFSSAFILRINYSIIPHVLTYVEKRSIIKMSKCQTLCPIKWQTRHVSWFSDPSSTRTYYIFILEVVTVPLKQTRHLRLMLAPYDLCKWQPLSRTSLWMPPSHTFITLGQISLLLQSLLPRSYVLHMSSDLVDDLRWQSGTSTLAEDINTHKCKKDVLSILVFCQSCSRSWQLSEGE